MSWAIGSAGLMVWLSIITGPGLFGGASSSDSLARDPTTTPLPPLLQLACQPLRDPQFRSLPEAIHLTGEVGCQQRGVDHQQHLVVLMGGGGAPVEGVGDQERLSKLVMWTRAIDPRCMSSSSGQTAMEARP
jgi:hypothetical protein